MTGKIQHINVYALLKIIISNVCHLKHIYIIPYPNTPASNYPKDFFHFHSYEDLKPLLPLHWQETTNNVRRNKVTQHKKARASYSDTSLISI